MGNALGNASSPGEEEVEVCLTDEACEAARRRYRQYWVRGIRLPADAREGTVRLRARAATAAAEVGANVADRWLRERRILHAHAVALLGHACRFGNIDAARRAFGMDVGVDVDSNAFEEDGEMAQRGSHMAATATYVAVAHRRVALLRDVLLPPPINADPNKGDTYLGWTPCHVACRKGYPDVVAVLLEYGANPNQATGGSGYTPCMAAVEYRKMDALRALVEGATRQGRPLNVNVVLTAGLYKGQTALDIAVRLDYREIAAYLHGEIGALTGEDLPRPKRPKSARKKTR